MSDHYIFKSIQDQPYQWVNIGTSISIQLKCPVIKTVRISKLFESQNVSRYPDKMSGYQNCSNPKHASISGQNVRISKTVRISKLFGSQIMPHYPDKMSGYQNCLDIKVPQH